MNENLKALMILNRVKGLGIQKLKAFLDDYGTPSAVLKECSRGKFREEIETALCEYEPEKDFERHAKLGIEILGFREAGYPRGLLEIYDAPMILYLRGRLYPEDFYSLSIVGTRNPSHYGTETALRFASALAERGLSIVSGFARGIDTASHQGAIRGKGRTIAVLGCGLDTIYPPENEKLYSEIAEHGALISEYPLGTQPLAYHFPQRNRIISGLSLGVLVVEAHEKSGSLITANFALEQGREVFAIPGRIDALSSRGTNRLIKSGALLTESPDDVILALAPLLRGYLKESEIEIPKGKDSESGGLLSCFKSEPITLEELAVISKRTPEEIASEVTRLEIKRLVKKLPNGRFTKIESRESED